MSSVTETGRPHWSGRLAFVLAATGSAVGLGNIWKFPYITGENGGGAFVLMYLFCIVAIGVPIMMAEILVGRRGQLSPISTMKRLAQSEGRSSAWKLVGALGLITGILILSFYSVVAGWALSYTLKSAQGVFANSSADQIGGIFGALVSDWKTLLLWHTVFMLMTMFVITRGVQKGLERAVMLLMPGLFVLLVFLVGYAAVKGDFSSGLHFLFDADFSKLSKESILVAMGHAFFTLSLGMGAIMMYGAYLPKHISIGKATLMVAFADTVVALLAGMAIFPLVFANGLEPAAGPGLIFQTLPLAFGQMPGGAIVATLFFVMLVFAAWSSAISLVEPAVAWMTENLGMTRNVSCWFVGVATWWIGIGTVLSFNEMAEAKLWGKTFFDVLDYLTTNIMLPLGGLLIAIFAAWMMHKSSLLDELDMEEGILFHTWRFLLRFVAPLAVIIISANTLGLIG